ncbi:hypothetical protein [Nocardia niwae]|uniref:hypothetical protein n=1 Tax=Nocardia niwae TaxID=626084 RepID=UPI000B337917|nr:hypothetical protein [Nocardia niwae]
MNPVTKPSPTTAQNTGAVTKLAVQKTGHPFALRTRRAARAMAAIVQHRAMQTDTLAAFLRTGRNHVYELAAALADEGMVRPLMKVGAGPSWIVPTPAGLGWYYGRRVHDWQPSPLWSVHARTVIQTRIALGARDYDDWYSERDMHYDSGYRGRYPYDAQWNHPDARVAVKVDTAAYILTPSKLGETVARVIGHARTDWCEGLLWVCNGATPAATVRTTLDQRAHHDDAPAVAVVEFADLTNPDVPVLTPWGVA